MSLSIIGIPATTRILNSLPATQQRKVLPKAARAGGSVFLKACRANAPGRNKIFKRSLILVVRRYKSGSFAIIGQDRGKVGKALGQKAKWSGGISGRGDVVPVHLVESPTKPHVVAAKNKRVLRFGFDEDTGTSAFVKSIRHPGTRGAHFIRKSARQAESSGVQAFTDKMRVETLIEAAKLGS